MAEDTDGSTWTNPQARVVTQRQHIKVQGYTSRTSKGDVVVVVVEEIAYASFKTKNNTFSTTNALLANNILYYYVVQWSWFMANLPTHREQHDATCFVDCSFGRVTIEQ